MLPRTLLGIDAAPQAVPPSSRRHGDRRRGSVDWAPGRGQGARGLHPVSVAIIMVGLLIAVVGVTYIWLSMEERAGHAIQIVNVRFDDATTTLHVLNVGEGAVTLDSVYLGGTRFLLTASNCTVASQPAARLDKGQTAEITVARSFHQKVHIKIVCRDGTAVEGDWAP